MKVAFHVKGDKEAMAAIKKLSVRYPGAFGSALYSEGLRVYAEARKRVPVDTSYLRESAYVTKPVLRSPRMRVEVGFGAEHAHTLPDFVLQQIHADDGVEGGLRLVAAVALARRRGDRGCGHYGAATVVVGTAPGGLVGS